MITYLLQVAICWGLFLGLYHLALRKETFFMVNRTYLLLTLVLGLIIPRLTWDTSMFMEEPAIETFVFMMSDGIQSFTEVIQPEQAPIGWLGYIYWLGVAVMLFKLLWGIGKVMCIRYQAEIIHEKDQVIAYTSGDHAPFTFFGTIYLSRKRNDQERDPEILTHEQAHVSGWHTIDVLFVEVVKAFFWFNPLVYSYDHAIKTVHEYIADANVLRRTALQRYGRLLLRQAQPGLEIALVNHFYNHQLKKRFNMMTRTPSQKRMLLKYLSVLPFILVVSLVFTNQKVQAEIGKVEEIKLEALFTINDHVDAIHDINWHPSSASPLLIAQTQKPFDLDIFDQNNNIIYSNETYLNNWNGRNLNGTSIENGNYTYIAKISDSHVISGKLSITDLNTRFSDLLNTIKSRFRSSEETNNNALAAICEPVAELNRLYKQAPIGSFTDAFFSNNTSTGSLIIETPENDNNPKFRKDLLITVMMEMEDPIMMYGSRFSDCSIFEKHSFTQSKYANSIFISLSKILNEHLSKRAELQDGSIARLLFNEYQNQLYKIGDQNGLKNHFNEWCDENGLKATFRGLKLTSVRFLKPLTSVDADTIPDITTDTIITYDPVTYKEKIEIVKVSRKAEFQKFQTAIKSNNKPLIVYIDVDKGEVLTQNRTNINPITQKPVTIDQIEHIHSIPKENKIYIYLDVPKYQTSEIFMNAEEMPEFPGGPEAMLQYLYTNIKYPKIARENTVQGMSVISFIVETDGSISQAKILRDPGAGTGAEALRVVNQMGREIKWKPGKQRGKDVRVQYNLPIKFALSDDYEVPAEEIIERTDYGKPVKDARGIWSQVDTVYTFYPERKEEEIKIVRTELGKDYILEVPEEEMEIFKIVEEMPEFPGGQTALLEYIFGNIEYPKIAKDNKVEGMAVISFVVEPDGSISQAKILRDPGAGTGAEALRVVNQMGQEFKWKPGKQRGQSVRVQYNLPVRFKVGDNLSISHNDNPLIVIFNAEGKEIYNLKGIDTELIEVNEISSINIIKGHNAIEQYGEKGINGVVEIHMIPGKAQIPEIVQGKINSNKVDMQYGSLNIFPNPVSQILTVDIKGVRDQTNLILSSIDGKVFYEELIIGKEDIDFLKEHAMSGPDFSVTHDMSNYEKGIYIVSIIQGDKVYSQPIVKK